MKNKKHKKKNHNSLKEKFEKLKLIFYLKTV